MLVGMDLANAPYDAFLKIAHNLINQKSLKNICALA